MAAIVVLLGNNKPRPLESWFIFVAHNLLRLILSVHSCSMKLYLHYEGTPDFTLKLQPEDNVTIADLTKVIVTKSQF